MGRRCKKRKERRERRCGTLSVEVVPQPEEYFTHYLEYLTPYSVEREETIDTNSTIIENIEE